MTGEEVLTRPAPPPDAVVPYGAGPEQVADVRFPPHQRGPAPLVIFLHGGFWRAAFDRTHAGPLATALAAAGYVVCVPEFRRVGQAGGGWPGTFDDVAAAVERLPARVMETAGPGTLSAVPALLSGHSAGGQLALWAAGRHLLPAGTRWHSPVRARGVVALAAVSDLALCHNLVLGRGAAAALLGGGPAEQPDRYRLTDPARLLPLGCPARLVHGPADDTVPCAMSRAYLTRARTAGGEVSLDEPPGAGHFDVIDPLSRAWPQVLAAFAALAPLTN